MKSDRTRPDAGPILEMTPDGQFLDARPAPLSQQLLRTAVVIAIIGTMLAVAAVALWFAMLLVPVVLAAGLLAYGLFRWRLWRSGVRFTPGMFQASSFGRQGNPFRR
jgi:O-antigen/teichoic acid export membrane protein